MLKWKLEGVIPFIKKSLTRWERPLTVVLGAAGLTVLLLNLDFNLLEASLYDLRMSRGLQAKPDTRIALVTLDDQTTQSLDEFPPLSMDSHARFMAALERLQPRAVGYLIDLNLVRQVNPELFQKNWANEFVDAVHRMESKGTDVLLGTRFDVTGEVLPPYPLSSLPHALAVIHKDGNVFSEDKITRRAFTHLYERPAFHLELAQRIGAVPPPSEGVGGKNPARSYPRGSFQVPEVDGRYVFFRYHGSTVMNPKSPVLPYQRISFIDVLENRLPAGFFKDKIVLVGSLMREESADFAFTPYSKTAFSNPKIVIHANVLDSLIHGDSIARVPHWVNWIATFSVTAFVLWWVMTSTPLYGVFATLSLTFGFVVTGQLLFQVRGLWLRESQPLVGIFVGYYLVVPYRLIREYKKRWDYQRKNELLTQVEELKTNFLNLVTHDLKTPVARIQGLAEVLLKKASERLVDRDRETLRHIISSTEELNHFITSILELSKVESNRLQLSFESRDINQLIERCVEGFKAQARVKQIRMNVSLEPLFPVRIDSSLISKVINNLIDNALKYSPANSEISIDSREEGTWICVSVRDQGIGMTREEQHSLFTRFYRAKNDTTTSISGSGLGLYLTKYFIEAHEGRVIVESEKDHGSVFKIYLPLEPAETNAGSPAGLSVAKFSSRDGRAEKVE